MVILLMDENTQKHCEPVLRPMLPFDYHTIVIPAGEKSKSWSTLMTIIDQIHQTAADRHALLLSLGGGVITDLGGMAASLYHRGISSIHIPTTLIGMCDAAIGGKNGINLNQAKNQVGTFYPPHAVFIFTEFLNTLPERELRNGYIELLKTLYLMRKPPSDLQQMTKSLDEAISEAAVYKHELTIEDLHDHGRRRYLNIGHTVGHALESYYLSIDQPILHGEAILLGLYYEHLYAEQPLQTQYFERIIHSDYPLLLQLDRPHVGDITRLLHSDKKKKSDTIQLPFLTDVFAWEMLDTDATRLSHHTIESWLS